MQNNENPENLVELIQGSVKAFSEKPMFGSKKSDGEYEWVTYAQVGDRVDNLRGGLAGIGIGKGDVVGVIVDNCENWAVAAFATYGLGGRFIPMYEKELPKTWEYIISDGGITALLVANQEVYDNVLGMKEKLPGLKHLYNMEGDGENSLAFLEDAGKKSPVDVVYPDPDDIAVLIYTSGTTGNPKGVLLSHRNFCTNFAAGGRIYPEHVHSNSRSMSILPWAHSFGQTAELYNFINVGGAVGFMESIKTLGEDLEKVKPTMLIAVPRVFNKIYDGLWAKMQDTGGVAEKLFLMGIAAARKKRELAANGQSDFLTNLKYGIAEKIVFKKIRDKFGGRLEAAITASATMNVEIGYFFSDIGIPVYDCYGLTETSPAVTMNCPTAHKPGSVGKPIDDVTVKIDRKYVNDGTDEGEIVVFGPNVMHGYHNKPDATDEVMTEDGGFRTGDRGRLDKDGYLYITGRFKEQYKLENGKYVFPASLEEDMKLSPFVANAMVFGEGRPYNVCLVVPDFEALKKRTGKNGFEIGNDGVVLPDGVTKMIGENVQESLKGKFGSYEIPKKFIYLKEDFSLENGMLTQTMKLKRRQVLSKYMPYIEELYGAR